MTAEFAELDEANRKVREWKREAKQCAPVSLAGGVDLTMSVDEMKMVQSPLSSFQVLRSSDILTQLVHIPSITTTAVLSATFGALVTLLLGPKSTFTPAARQGFLRRWTRRLLRFTATAVASVVFIRFLRERYPTVQRVSEYESLSSSPDAPCFVANRILTMTSSQAGTHADGPHHFCRSLSHRNFDDAHYSGDAVVLDIVTELRKHHQSLGPHAPLAITVDVLEKAREKLPAIFRDGSRPVWRLLLVTRHSSVPCATRAYTTEALRRPLHVDSPLDVVSRTPVARAGVTGATAARRTTSPSKAYAFVDPEAVDYLQHVFPRLVLLGIDSPSVDPPEAMPPGKSSHGALVRCGMAVLENLRYTRLFPLLESPVGDTPRGWISGSMLTVFNATQNYDDARGCSVIFFPEEAV
ncbi:hypothetical protein, unknown function [Leishmania tarentolae]|uniref:Uncharacterized protein n=1 Tax=Leishmania tarentolae TaxID=5689 RepID=A0A640KQS8_LEITA|nr:hypothetical protein, unknown function [Leishmania tarentolae]